MYVFTQANAAEMGRTVICVGSGNEGSSGGHLSGSLLEEPEAGPFPGGQRAAGSGEAVPSRMGNAVARSVSVELAVAEYERSLNIQLWKNYCDEYRIYLRSPGGQEAQLPEMINGGKYILRLEQTEIMVYFGQPAPYAVPEEIYFELLPMGGSYINSGMWVIRLEPVRVVTGRYYFYLPSAAVRGSGTGFYRSTPEVTLTIPSTAAKVISVGAYDSTYEAYADFSGRGYYLMDFAYPAVFRTVSNPSFPKIRKRRISGFIKRNIIFHHYNVRFRRQSLF